MLVEDCGHETADEPKSMDRPGIGRASRRGGVPELGLEKGASRRVQAARIIGGRVVAAQRSAGGASDGAGDGNAQEGRTGEQKPGHSTTRQEQFHAGGIYGEW